jgi:hypothetical protein
MIITRPALAISRYEWVFKDVRKTTRGFKAQAKSEEVAMPVSAPLKRVPLDTEHR